MPFFFPISIIDIVIVIVIVYVLITNGCFVPFSFPFNHHPQRSFIVVAAMSLAPLSIHSQLSFIAFWLSDKWLLRILQDQQEVRYNARTKRIFAEGASLAQAALPVDTAQFGQQGGDSKGLEGPALGVHAKSLGSGCTSLPGNMSQPDAAMSAVAPANSAMQEEDDDEQMEEREIKLLGLEPINSRKRRKSEASGHRATKRRSQEDVIGEEVAKLEAEVLTMISSLAEWPQKPSGYDLGTLDRKLTTKIKSFKASGQFDFVQSLETMQTEIKTAREAMTAATKYLPPKGLPNKKFLEPFYKIFSDGMQKCPKVINAFPQVVQRQFTEACNTKAIEAEDWSTVAMNLAVERLHKAYGDEGMEKTAFGFTEKALSCILTSDVSGDSLDEVVKTLKAFIGKLIEVRPPEIVQTNLELILQIAELDCSGCQDLESAIKTVDEQATKPIIRVLKTTEMGKDLLARAQEHHDAILVQESKCASVQQLKAMSSNLVFFLSHAQCQKNNCHSL